MKVVLLRDILRRLEAAALAAGVVWAVIVITGGNLTVLNDTVMSSSLYYKAFNLFNPFL